MRTKTTEIIGCILLITALSHADGSVDPADALYHAHRESLYQVRVIEITSGKKASIGSAFSVSTNGQLVTNYHVVSRAIRYPHLYRLECVGSDGETLPLKIMDIDVVHDLAVVQSDSSLKTSLTPSHASLNKGATLYALGNPMDLGMVIVDGTYNGLLKKSFYEKILFSGSLNSGMSGGPAIDSNGQVVGISVSTAGQQISFLVPVKYLKTLLDRIENVGPETHVNLHKRIEQQLIENQKRYMSRLIDAEWPLDPLGDARVPRIEDDAIHSWGDTKRDVEALYERTYMICGSKDWIYLSPSFFTGKVTYQCKWYVSKELNTPRFYNLLEHDFGNTSKLNPAGKDDVTNFESRADFVRIAGRDWRVVLSTRNYKKYPLLYDIVVTMVSVTNTDRALLVDLMLFGVSEDMGLAFTRTFMEAIQWQD
ncbi:MAG: trypsin-like peptidase domain-containing protein [Lentisphaerae bacterium]|nr:trypsin-like peptidase domain-containing protein [Lentisphaerota bacterium]